jgi:hypothetical protein
LDIAGEHGPALGHDEHRNVGHEVDAVEAEVVAELLPGDQVAEGGQVSNALCVELSIGKEKRTLTTFIKALSRIQSYDRQVITPAL